MKHGKALEDFTERRWAVHGERIYLYSCFHAHTGGWLLSWCAGRRNQRLCQEAGHQHRRKILWWRQIRQERRTQTCVQPNDGGYITRKLNDENVTRQQRGNTKISGFTDRTIRAILKNPVYEGKIAYGRRHTVKVEGTNNETKVVKQDDESKIILVDGLHDAIISEETFERAQSLLAKRAAHRKTRSDSTNIYPLTGLIKCPDCGKNLFGYTAPQRPRKNGKEGFYPRYISYRCISGRDRNGLICSLANKYYSGTKLEKEVRDVISAMVTIPEFVELISKKVDCETDIERLRKKRAGIEAEHNKYRNNQH